jgi:hypothetical protein
LIVQSFAATSGKFSADDSGESRWIFQL